MGFDKMLYEFTHKNIGELLTRYKKIDIIIRKTKEELNNCESEESNYILGKYAALTDCRSSSHKSIIDEVIESKKKIESLDNDYYEDEISFYKGYINGLELLLETDRSFFDDRNDIVVFLFSIDEDICTKYDLAFQHIKYFDNFESNGKNRYYVSNDVDDIKNKALDLADDTEFVIIIAYTKDSMPNTGIMQKLSFSEDYNVFLHKVKDGESIEQMIKRTVKATVV